MFGFLKTKKRVVAKKTVIPAGMKTIGSRHDVFAGKAHHTKSGLKAKDLAISKHSGKVVSKKKQAHGHRIMRNHPEVARLFDIHRAPAFTTSSRKRKSPASSLW